MKRDGYVMVMNLRQFVSWRERMLLKRKLEIERQLAAIANERVYLAELEVAVNHS